MSFSLEFVSDEGVTKIDQQQTINPASTFNQSFRCYKLDRNHLAGEPGLWSGISIPVEGASINWQAIADAVDRQISTISTHSSPTLNISPRRR